MMNVANRLVISQSREDDQAKEQLFCFTNDITKDFVAKSSLKTSTFRFDFTVNKKVPPGI